MNTKKSRINFAIPLRRAEKNYYKNMLDKNKNNLSKIWKTLNLAINRKKKVKANCTFKYNNRTLSDNKEIASNFNNYFKKWL